MKKSRATLIIVLATLLISVTGCATGGPAQSPTPGNTDDFNFVFKYGFTGRNELDTFQGTYTKDMALDTPITISLPLTEEEKDKIYQKMEEIDFFNYPDKFSVTVPDNEPKTRVVLYSTYFFKVTHHGQTKELLWHDKTTNRDEMANRLVELISLIRNIIESREEYKNLPEPASNYLLTKGHEEH